MVYLSKNHTADKHEHFYWSNFPHHDIFHWLILICHVSGVCSPESKDGTCLGQVTVPAQWWPSITAHGAPRKMPRIMSSVYYSVRTVSGDCSVTSARDPGVRVLIPPQHVGQVELTGSQSGYQQLAGDEFLHMLIPQTSLYPGSRLYVPVFVEQPQVSNKEIP